MREIIWLDSAVNDLTRLRRFIAEKNQSAAKRAAEAIQMAAKLLVQNPLIGKPVSNLAFYRDLPTRFGVGGYIIRYRVYHDTIYIVHVRHYRENDFKV